MAVKRLGIEMAAVAVADAARKRRREMEFFILIKWLGRSLPFSLQGATFGLRPDFGCLQLPPKAKDRYEIFHHR